MLTWSNLDNVLHDLRVSNDLSTHYFHADDGFLGTWTFMRAPHRGTWKCLLSNRLLVENSVMKKISVEESRRMVLLKSL